MVLPDLNFSPPVDEQMIEEDEVLDEEMVAEDEEMVAEDEEMVAEVNATGINKLTLLYCP
jgi:hypothetical protein